MIALNKNIDNIVYTIYNKAMSKVKFREIKGRNVQYLEEGGKWTSTGKSSIAEAKEWYYSGKGKRDIKLIDIADGIFTDRSDGSYIDIMQKTGRIQSEEALYIYNVFLKTYILPHLGNIKIRDISSPMVQSWYINLKKTDGKDMVNAYRNNILEVLSLIMKWAMYNGIIDHNPVSDIYRMPSDNSGRRAFSNEELKLMFPEDKDRLISIWGNIKNACYFLIFRDTGWRPGEILSITPFNILDEYKAISTTSSFDSFSKKIKNSIKTTKKGSKYKIGFLSDFTYSLLKDICSTIEYDKYVFEDEYGIIPTSKHMLNIFHRSLDSIGIDSEGRPQYSLRTTFMTNISNTMSKDKVMLLMGHKQWRECYDKRTAEDLIKNFKTM